MYHGNIVITEGFLRMHGIGFDQQILRRGEIPVLHPGTLYAMMDLEITGRESTVIIESEWHWFVTGIRLND